MTANITTDGNAALHAYADAIHPQMEIAPCDLQIGGRYALPPAFDVHIDPAHADEWITLFGPGDTSTRLRTLSQYGGRALVRGLDLLKALATVLRTGPPTWERSLDAQATYWRLLLATAPTFTIPAPQPLDRQAIDLHLDACMICRPHVEAMARKIDGGRSLPTTAELRSLMASAHATPERTPARAKRTNTTTMTATEV